MTILLITAVGVSHCRCICFRLVPLVLPRLHVQREAGAALVSLGTNNFPHGLKQGLCQELQEPHLAVEVHVPGFALVAHGRDRSPQLLLPLSLGLDGWVPRGVRGSFGGQDGSKRALDGARWPTRWPKLLQAGLR